MRARRSSGVVSSLLASGSVGLCPTVAARMAALRAAPQLASGIGTRALPAADRTGVKAQEPVTRYKVTAEALPRKISQAERFHGTFPSGPAMPPPLTRDIEQILAQANQYRKA